MFFERGWRRRGTVEFCGCFYGSNVPNFDLNKIDTI